MGFVPVEEENNENLKNWMFDVYTFFNSWNININIILFSKQRGVLKYLKFFTCKIPFKHLKENCCNEIYGKINECFEEIFWM